MQSLLTTRYNHVSDDPCTVCRFVVCVCVCVCVSRFVHSVAVIGLHPKVVSSIPTLDFLL